MSVIRLLHTADNHLGLTFTGRGYSDALRQQLVDERYRALERVVAEANARSAPFLVVAGDLFDRLDLPRRDVERAAEILNSFTGIHVVVLPGNHDFYERGHEKLWGWFRDAMDEHRLAFLGAGEPLTVPVDDREVVFYPAPCASKTSPRNAIEWVARAAKDPARLNIGVAHGSVTGISPDRDDRYFPMTPEELGGAGVDFWLLGHTHLRHPPASEAGVSPFYLPSTHTPDGFDCDHEGYVWLLEVDGAKSVRATSLRTGAFRFQVWERDLRSAEAVDRLERDLAALDPASTLLKLVLRGRLPADGKERLARATAAAAGRLAYLEVHDGDVGFNIDREYIDRTFSAGSLPHRLLSALSTAGQDDLALQLAHDLIREVRQ